MTQLTWGRAGLLSGGNDVFLVGVRDIEITGSFAAPVVWTAGMPGNSGLAGHTVSAAGTLSRFDQAGFPAWTRAGQDIDIQPLTLDGMDYLAVTGVNDAGLWAYRLAPNDTIPGRGTTIGNGPLPRDLAVVHSVDIDGETHVFGARKGIAQIESWRVTDNSTLGGQKSFAAGTTAGPLGLVAIDSIVQGGERVLVVAGDGRDALMSYRLTTGGEPRLADRVAVDDGLGIAAPSALELVTLEGRSFAILAASGSGTISVFEIAADGGLRAVDHVMDGLDTRFANVAHLRIAELNGAIYVAAAGSDHGVTLFQLLPGGRLLHQMTQEDTLNLGLSDVSALAMRATETDLQIAVGSETEQGLTWLTATPKAQGVTLHGTGANATLAGTSGDDMLLGGAGDERIIGGGGGDLLRDGAGRDTLIGGDGADVFVLDADGEADRIEGFQVQQDRIDLSDWTFFRNTGQLTITTIAGGVRIVFGDERLDVLTDGGRPLPAETLHATDLTDLDRLLPGWFERIHDDSDQGGGGTGSGTSGGDASGDEDPTPGMTVAGSNRADTLNGGDADDLVLGGAGDDHLLGWGGQDTLNGGTGADRMIGGDGSDRYIVDHAGDVVLEHRKWAGTDTVISAVDFRMGRRHIEDLKLTGDTWLGAGNGLENRLIGNDGDNLLDGGPRNDVLIGGRGNDIYFVRAPGDQVIEKAGQGIDTIKAFQSVALPDNVENLHIQGLWTKAGDPVQGMVGIGNDQANVIVGNPFDNMIAGGGGRDVLKGQGGADTFVFDRAPGRDNVDRITDFTPGEDRIRIKADLFGLDPLSRTPNWMFNLGDRATKANDVILYDSATGAIRIDPDGTGPARPMVTFILDGQVDLSHTDVFLF